MMRHSLRRQLWSWFCRRYGTRIYMSDERSVVRVKIRVKLARLIRAGFRHVERRPQGAFISGCLPYFRLLKRWQDIVVHKVFFQVQIMCLKAHVFKHRDQSKVQNGVGKIFKSGPETVSFFRLYPRLACCRRISCHCRRTWAHTLDNDWAMRARWSCRTPTRMRGGRQHATTFFRQTIWGLQGWENIWPQAPLFLW